MFEAFSFYYKSIMAKLLTVNTAHPASDDRKPYSLQQLHHMLGATDKTGRPGFFLSLTRSSNITFIQQRERMVLGKREEKRKLAVFVKTPRDYVSTKGKETSKIAHNSRAA